MKYFLKEYKITCFLMSIILVLLLLPMNGGESEGTGFLSKMMDFIPFLDKIAHIMLFCVLSLVNFLENKGRFSGITCVSGLSIFAVSTEVLQKISGYRSFDVQDIIADFLGVAFGFYLGKKLEYFMRKDHSSDSFTE